MTGLAKKVFFAEALKRLLIPGAISLLVIGYCVLSYLIVDNGRNDPVYRLTSIPRTSLVLIGAGVFAIGIAIEIARQGLSALGRLAGTPALATPDGALTYRPDVDGLRAIAVLGVFAFHVDLFGLTGGFVGVDVFFVISGYLISSIIQHEVWCGNFSWRRFIARRVRRIIPALYIVIAATLAAASLLYLPKEMDSISTTALYAVVLVQNVYFYLQANYFAAPPEFNALIHLWSLGVEEQFYLLFPPLFGALLLVRRRRWFGLFMLGLVIAFFALSVGLTWRSPEFAFYMVISRAWEFLFGIALALRVVPPLRSRAWNTVMAGAGLALILLAFTLPPEVGWFPAPMALIPCLGAALVIHAGHGTATPVSALLGWRPIVLMGLISYSFYLWHWPIFSLYKYYKITTLTGADQAVVFILSLGLSVLTYRLVERPLRRGLFTRHPRRDATFVAVASAALFGVAGVAVLTGGLPQRIPNEALQAVAPSVTYEPRRSECLGLMKARHVREGKLCLYGTGGDPRALLWGDSHAAAAASAFEVLGRRHDMKIVIATRSSCRPTLTQLRFDSRGNDCHAFNLAVRDLIARQGITDVVLVAKWGHFAAASANHYPTAAIETTVQDLLDDGVRVWILQQVPFHRYDVPATLARLAMTRRGPEALGQDFIGLSLQDYREQQAELKPVFAALAAMGARILDPAEYLCDGERFCRADADGVPLYRDQHHVNTLGAARLMPLFDQPVAAAAQRAAAVPAR